MKFILFISGIGLFIILFLFFIAVRIWCVHETKDRIIIAMNKYHGTAEEALIAYLSDTTNSPRDRTDVAIWTLGQIRSEKALDVLYELYKNDPHGKTCRGRHDEVVCQREIHKAIRNIEKHWWLFRCDTYIPVHVSDKNFQIPR